MLTGKIPSVALKNTGGSVVKTPCKAGKGNDCVCQVTPPSCVRDSKTVFSAAQTQPVTQPVVGEAQPIPVFWPPNGKEPGALATRLQVCPPSVERKRSTACEPAAVPPKPARTQPSWALTNCTWLTPSSSATRDSIASCQVCPPSLVRKTTLEMVPSGCCFSETATHATLPLRDVKTGGICTVFPAGYGGVTFCQLFPPSVVCKIRWVVVRAQPVVASLIQSALIGGVGPGDGVGVALAVPLVVTVA